jgi:hypothetical protein
MTQVLTIKRPTVDIARRASNRPAGRPGTGCEVCGAEARVRILEDYARGKPVARRFCLACAERMHDDAAQPRRSLVARLGAAVWVVATGLIAIAVIARMW